MIDSILLIAGVFNFLEIPEQTVDLHDIIAMIAVFLYALLSLAARSPRRWVKMAKLFLLLLAVGFTLVSSTMHFMELRAQRGAHTNVHDHPLQMEEAVNFLLQGRNPYVEHYRGTPMEQWWPKNPALDHVIALPTTFLKSVPFALASKAITGRYDDRLSQFFSLALALFSLYFLFRSDRNKLIAIIVLAFNPLFMKFFIEGRGDIVFLSFLLASLALLRRGWIQASLLLLVLSVTSKHMAWFIVPFFLTYLASTGYLRQKAVRRLAPSVVLAACIILPFALWDFAAFFEDIYSYAAGTVQTSYPINGFSLAALAKMRGMIQTGYSAWIFQLFLLPLLAWQMFDVWRRPFLGRMMMHYGLFLWAFLFLSRFFHNNYMGVIVTILAVGLLLMHEEEPEKEVGA